MTAVPLPASPCVRVSMDYLQLDAFVAVSRFFLSYAGSPPSGANCVTLATDVMTAWVAHLSPLIDTDYGLVEVDVLDIGTDSGLSGQWTGNETATRSGVSLPSQCAVNVEYNIERRYRGGKPRMFLPSAVQTDLQDADHWNVTFIDEANAGMAAFFAELEALSIGSLGTLAHVNLSYYKGFTNLTNSSGRERAVPTYRDAALLDTVVGYSCKALMGSQRRRRAAVTA